MPDLIKKMKESGLLVKDMYKSDHPEIPTNGGLIILLISIVSISILSLFYSRYITPMNYAIIIVVSLFAFFGILDDHINIGRPAKLLLLYYCSYLLIPLIETSYTYLPALSTLNIDILYLQLLCPLYVMVASNLINMHSGYNGLAPGLSLIILITLIIKSYFFGNIMSILFIVCLAGSLAGYFLFEKYPSKIFWGNIGALSVGAGIGAVIIVQGYLVAGFVMLIPHTVNFLLYVYWRMNAHKYPIEKFGKIRGDGTLEVPNPFTLKWMIPYYFRVTEYQCTLILYSLTGICCLIGYFIPW